MKTLRLTTEGIVNEIDQQIDIHEIIEYYSDATMDYREWSPSFNMHFGYFQWKRGMSIREKQLMNMNLRILNELQVEQGKVLDLGCGMGATMKFAGNQFKQLDITGITITPWQVTAGNKLLRQPKIILGDYAQLPFADETIDGAYNLESLCHATNKSAVIKEVTRVLKQGQRWVIADGFLFKKPSQISPLLRKLYRMVSDNWAVPDFPEYREIIDTAKKCGLKLVADEDASFKIAPTAFVAPLLTVKYFIKQKLKGVKMNVNQINHLKACFGSLFLGLNRHFFKYRILTFEKI